MAGITENLLPELKLFSFATQPSTKASAFRTIRDLAGGTSGMFRRDEANVGHRTACGAKAPCIADLRCDRQRRQIVDAAEASQALHTCAKRVEIGRGPQIVLDVVGGAPWPPRPRRYARSGLRAQTGPLPALWRWCTIRRRA
jgi:hypothetical protein